jgi:5-methyltetrahydropteroyltriglutamate--homocysteine methyltransferase
MTASSSAPYRVDLVGSLIRPPELKQARIDWFFNRISLDELRAVEDRLISEAIAMQRNAGIRLVSDGEFRRRYYNSSVFESATGLTANYKASVQQQQGDPEKEFPDTTVVGKIRRDPTKRNLTRDEVQFMSRYAAGPFKMTIPSLSLVTEYESWFKPGITDKVYESQQAMLEDIEELIKDDVRYAASNGCNYISIDNPSYNRFMATEERKRLVDAGYKVDSLLQETIDQDNRLIDIAKDLGVTVGVHICLGADPEWREYLENRVTHFSADYTNRVFEELHADAFTCECSYRSSLIDSLRNKPNLGEKVIALGIVDTLHSKVETVDFVVQQIEAAARYLDLANLAVTTNCGFSGVAADCWVDVEAQARKLDVLSQASARVWGTT